MSVVAHMAIGHPLGWDRTHIPEIGYADNLQPKFDDQLTYLIVNVRRSNTNIHPSI